MSQQPDQRPVPGDERDRDPAGRARNARPRDAAGRPMAKGDPGVDRVPEDLELRPAQALAEAQRLLDAGLPFQAHEVLEGTWKATEGVERPLWQGLAQLAVGLTHAQRGNSTGAAALLERGAERIAPFAAEPPHGLDVAGLSAHASGLADRVRADGLGALTEADRRPRLCR
ncbi:MAG TPA: DUF309 domain-containing protein [Pseudonocardia sp.]|jgi:hypothetical protein